MKILLLSVTICKEETCKPSKECAGVGGGQVGLSGFSFCLVGTVCKARLEKNQENRGGFRGHIAAERRKQRREAFPGEMTVKKKTSVLGGTCSWLWECAADSREASGR